MITPELVKKRGSKNGEARCVICVGTSVNIKKVGSNFVVVCVECFERFTMIELELMHNLFIAFGGYFGKCGSSKEESYLKLEEIAKEYSKLGKNVAEIVNDLETTYQALLHGITPVQLVQGLRVLSK